MSEQIYLEWSPVLCNGCRRIIYIPGVFRTDYTCIDCRSYKGS